MGLAVSFGVALDHHNSHSCKNHYPSNLLHGSLKLLSESIRINIARSVCCTVFYGQKPCVEKRAPRSVSKPPR